MEKEAEKTIKSLVDKRKQRPGSVLPIIKIGPHEYGGHTHQPELPLGVPVTEGHSPRWPSVAALKFWKNFLGLDPSGSDIIVLRGLLFHPY
jgi:hypothetical protein